MIFGVVNVVLNLVTIVVLIWAVRSLTRHEQRDRLVHVSRTPLATVVGMLDFARQLPSGDTRDRALEQAYAYARAQLDTFDEAIADTEAPRTP